MMRQKRFTDSKLRSLKAPKKPTYLWEGNGFGIRLQPSGTKTFVQWFRYRGKVEGISLGRYPIMTLAQARAKAAKNREKLEKGLHPNGGQKGRASQGTTVSDLAEEYLLKYAMSKKRSWEQDARYLSSEIVPVLGRMKIADVARRDIVLLLDEIVERGSPISANRCLSLLSKLFIFAVQRGLAEKSPVVFVARPGGDEKGRKRERYLNDAEIKTFWTSLEQCAMSPGIRLALRLLLVTGQRRGELAKATWGRIDLKKRIWHIPAEHSKNKLPHEVPLTDLAIQILMELKDLSAGSEFAIPSPSRPTHITERSITRALRTNEAVINLPHFTPHDLRRTAVTHLRELGVDRFIVKRIVNHIENDDVTDGTYDQHGYFDEKLDGLNLWANKLKSLVGEGGYAKKKD